MTWTKQYNFSAKVSYLTANLYCLLYAQRTVPSVANPTTHAQHTKKRPADEPKPTPIIKLTTIITTVTPDRGVERNKKDNKKKKGSVALAPNQVTQGLSTVLCRVSHQTGIRPCFHRGKGNLLQRMLRQLHTHAHAHPSSLRSSPRLSLLPTKAMKPSSSPPPNTTTAPHPPTLGSLPFYTPSPASP